MSTHARPKNQPDKNPLRIRNRHPESFRAPPPSRPDQQQPRVGQRGIVFLHQYVALDLVHDWKWTQKIWETIGPLLEKIS